MSDVKTSSKAGAKAERPNKRKLQAQATRKSIVDAMHRLVAEKGYEAVTVDDIAKECGIGKGTLYHYFKSKDDIFGYIERGRFDDLPQLVASRELPTIEERLAAYLELWFGYVASDSRNMAAFWYRQALSHGLPGSREGTHFSDDIDNLEKMLAEAVGSGELVEGTPVDVIARDIVFAINGAAYYRCLDDGDFSLSEWAEAFIEHVLPAHVAPFKVMHK